jgi:hypothetical protein
MCTTLHCLTYTKTTHVDWTGRLLWSEDCEFLASWETVSLSVGALLLEISYCVSMSCTKTRLGFDGGVRVRVRITLRLAVYRQSIHLGAKPLETHDQRFYFNCTLEVLVLRGWFCRVQLLLVLASAVILVSESRGTHDDVLLTPRPFYTIKP